MDIRTKAYSLPKSIYFKECYKNIILSQWWLILIFNAILGCGIYYKIKWLIITCGVIEVLYFIFWIIQLIGVQYLQQASIIFKKVFYIFNENYINICISENERAMIKWDQVKKIKLKKNYAVIFLEKAHIIYVPYSSVKSGLEKNIFINLLKARQNKK